MRYGIEEKGLWQLKTKQIQRDTKTMDNKLN